MYIYIYIYIYWIYAYWNSDKRWFTPLSDNRILINADVPPFLLVCHMLRRQLLGIDLQARVEGGWRYSVLRSCWCCWTCQGWCQWKLWQIWKHLTLRFDFESHLRVVFYGLFDRHHCAKFLRRSPPLTTLKRNGWCTWICSASFDRRNRAWLSHWASTQHQTQTLFQPLGCVSNWGVPPFTIICSHFAGTLLIHFDTPLDLGVAYFQTPPVVWIARPKNKTQWQTEPKDSMCFLVRRTDSLKAHQDTNCSSVSNCPKSKTEKQTHTQQKCWLFGQNTHLIFTY